MQSKELITLQFGKVANNAASHFWNIQDEVIGLDAEGTENSTYEHSALFETLERQGRVSHVPRCLMLDISGCLGGNQVDCRGDNAAVLDTWGGKVVVHRATPVPKSQFVLELEKEEEEAMGTGDVWRERLWDSADQSQDAATPDPLAEAARQLEAQYDSLRWADFLKARIRPQNVWQWPGCWAESEVLGFGSKRLSFSNSLQEEVTDRIRKFAENCERLQGFQVWVDDLTGFGGTCSAVLDYLLEDYTKTAILACPIRCEQQPLQGQQLRVHRLGALMSLADLSRKSDLYLPLAAPTELAHAAWPAKSLFHSTALVAAFLDTATLPFRTQSHLPGTYSFHDFVAALNSRQVQGNLIFGAASMPADLPTAYESIYSNYTDNVSSFSPLMSYAGWKDDIHQECLVVRGAIRDGLSPYSSGSVLRPTRIHGGTPASRHTYLLDQRMPVPLPFPQLFSQFVGPSGDLQPHERPAGVEVTSVPTLTQLAAAGTASRIYRQSAAELMRMGKTGTGSQLLESWEYDALEVEDFVESLHEMSKSSNEEEAY